MLERVRQGFGEDSACDLHGAHHADGASSPLGLIAWPHSSCHLRGVHHADCVRVAFWETAKWLFLRAGSSNLHVRAWCVFNKVPKEQHRSSKLQFGLGSLKNVPNSSFDELCGVHHVILRFSLRRAHATSSQGRPKPGVENS